LARAACDGEHVLRRSEGQLFRRRWIFVLRQRFNFFSFTFLTGAIAAAVSQDDGDAVLLAHYVGLVLLDELMVSQNFLQ
jgi:hypothetical protein